MASLIDTDDAIETVLFICRNVKVYKIPPRPNLSGWKAQDWGEDSFMWEGRLRILQKGGHAVIKLEDSNTGEMFANCPYDPPGSSVEPVLDSSRYFVLRIVDESGRKASIGMGFEERGDAFDFNVALQDHLKHLSSASSPASSSSSTASSTAKTEPKRDFSLKEGQTFSISIPGASGKPRPKKPEGGGGGGLFMLPPPPSGGSQR
ncbi:Uncharacterized conserved protein [Phaffia rhodozyma]|uniref:Uncharacterized conserved protein n=1 Tax=Phaffia rhodozyma TaxID=264483 RepID=A0A0F7SNM7_PHARH|nr:Uncharacterized conserved protein [Phaffia rhodozyma]